MKRNEMSPALFSAHCRAADDIASDYLRDLSSVDITSDAALRFGTLESRFSTFRTEYCQRVRSYAAVRGIYRFNVRELELIAYARAEIRLRLNAHPKLAKRLLAIRTAQTAKAADATHIRSALAN